MGICFQNLQLEPRQNYKVEIKHKLEMGLMFRPMELSLMLKPMDQWSCVAMKISASETRLEWARADLELV